MLVLDYCIVPSETRILERVPTIALSIVHGCLLLDFYFAVALAWFEAD
jgi:hypothetical protein